MIGVFYVKPLRLQLLAALYNLYLPIGVIAEDIDEQLVVVPFAEVGECGILDKEIRHIVIIILLDRIDVQNVELRVTVMLDRMVGIGDVLAFDVEHLVAARHTVATVVPASLITRVPPYSANSGDVILMYVRIFYWMIMTIPVVVCGDDVNRIIIFDDFR